jgi:hypothetical protein
MHTARTALRDLPIEIPLDPLQLSQREREGEGEKEGEGEDAPPLTSFRLQVATHTPRSLQPLPDFMSSEKRLAFDMTRSVMLAGLLDEERGVSEENTLATILSVLAAGTGTGAGADTGGAGLAVADTLDIAIAYLRKVHLFVYYSGKSFMDEAQLLTIAPSIVGRSLPPPPPAPVTEEEGKKEERGAGDGEDSEHTQVSADVFPGKTSPAILALDKRVTDFLDAAKHRVENMRANKADTSVPLELSADQQDANTIAEAQNNVSEC